MSVEIAGKKIATGAIVGIGLALFLVIALLVGFTKFNGLRNQAVSKEAALIAQYQDNQNELSTYILQFKESMGVAAKGSERLEAILVEAIKGRYDGNMSPGTDGSMFSAIAEAYPDLTATTESYAKVQDLVVSGRNAYKNKQTKLLDMIRDYETWRETDLINSFIIRNWVGAPTDRLKVTVDGEDFIGEAALAKISQIVLTRDAIDAYSTGEMDALIVDDTVSGESDEGSDTAGESVSGEESSEN